MSLRSDNRVVMSATIYDDVRFGFTSGCLYRGLISYLRLFAYSDVQHILTIWVTGMFSYKRHELLALRRCLGLPPIFGGVSVAHILVFCVVILIFFLLCLVYPILPVSLDCPLLIAFIYLALYFSMINASNKPQPKNWINPRGLHNERIIPSGTNILIFLQ